MKSATSSFNNKDGIENMNSESEYEFNEEGKNQYSVIQEEYN